MLLLLIVGTGFLGFAVFLVADAATAPQRAHQAALKRAAHYGLSRVTANPQLTAHFRERVLLPAVQRLAAIALRLNPKASTELVARRLLASGLSARLSATQFLALKAALAICGAVFFAVFGISSGSVPIGILLTPLAGVFGFLAPDVYLTMRIRGRREAVRAQLPDALDLLAVSVEAGLGLDGALSKLTEHMEGPLVEEFAVTLGEIRIGESRHEALKKLTERVPTPEVASFVRAVIQAEQLGISLGRILRVQAADSRLRRQAAAEEKAMKAPIKILFPTVIFIFPALFLVILGPAFLNITHYLGK
ncbi:MAG TPA: type II secretion system F family protein [Gaiellaceae bacterium]|jgi:tight adherence protein C